MAISTLTQVDYLWKKVIYGVTKSDAATSKSGSNETIPSPITVYSSSIWSQADSASIPATPPASTTTTVILYQGADRIQTVPDTTSGTNGNRPTWNTNLTNWIPPTFGSGYAVAVFLGDPQTTGVQIFPDTTNNEWVFDYNAGVLNFAASLPVGNAQWVNGVYIRGYRYIGNTGIGQTVVQTTSSGIYSVAFLSTTTGTTSNILVGTGITFNPANSVLNVSGGIYING